MAADQHHDQGELDRLSARLEALAKEIAAEQDPGRAAELVQEASKLATDAGEEADRVLREAAKAPEPQPE